MGDVDMGTFPFSSTRLRSVDSGRSKPSPTIANTVLTAAILNAGRISLDQKRPVGISKDSEHVTNSVYFIESSSGLSRIAIFL